MSLDLLDIMRSKGFDPQSGGQKHGGCFKSPCPLCGGEDRFSIWPGQPHDNPEIPPGGFYCYQCGVGGDLVQFFVDVEGMSFAEAFEAVGVKADSSKCNRRNGEKEARPQRRTFQPREWDKPSETWQAQALKTVEQAHAALLRSSERLQWLHDRGLSLGTIKRFKLGWLAGEKGRRDRFRSRKAWDLPEKIENGKNKPLWLPRGWVIPWTDSEGRVLRLRIRRPNGDLDPNNPKDIKYYAVPGSSMGTMVINPEAKAFVVVEGEFDAMLLAQEGAGLVGAVSVLTVGGKPDAVAMPVLVRAVAVLVALDFDPPKGLDQHRAGAVAAKWWLENMENAKRWPPVGGKDPGDMAVAGRDIRAWILAGLPLRVKVLAELAEKDAAEAAAAEAKPVPNEVPQSGPFHVPYIDGGNIRRKTNRQKFFQWLTDDMRRLGMEETAEALARFRRAFSSMPLRILAHEFTGLYTPWTLDHPMAEEWGWKTKSFDPGVHIYGLVCTDPAWYSRHVNEFWAVVDDYDRCYFEILDWYPEFFDGAMR